MKKVITSIAITCIASASIATNLHAQDFALSTMPIKKTFILPAEYLEDTVITLESTTSNLANSGSKSMKELKKAAREFKQFNRLSKNFENKFKGATNVKWDKHKTGYCGTFMKDGLRNLVWYSKSGYLTSSMVTYFEDRLREDVKDIVNDAYEDYNIILVNEVHHSGATVYVVTIENEKNIKLVTVCDGQMNLYKEYRKGA